MAPIADEIMQGAGYMTGIETARTTDNLPRQPRATRCSAAPSATRNHRAVYQGAA